MMKGHTNSAELNGVELSILSVTVALALSLLAPDCQLIALPGLPPTAWTTGKSLPAWLSARHASKYK